MTQAIEERPRLAVIARGYAAQKEEAPFFRRQEAIFLTGLCSGPFEVDCLVPLVGSSNPLFQTLSVYDTPISRPDFHVVPLPSYPSVTPSLWNRVVTWMVSARILWRQIRRSDQALILMPSPIGLIALALSLLSRRKFVVYYGGDWSAHLEAVDVVGLSLRGIYSESARAVRGLLQRLVFRAAPTILVRDTTLYQKLRTRRGGAHLATAATNVTPSDIYLREDTCQGSQIKLLTVCTLRPAKGIPDILAAVRRLTNEGHDVIWEHAGLIYEDYAIQVQQHIVELGLNGRVTFLGYQPGDTVVDIYREADVFVLASHTEGFPRVLVEALSQSLPVVTTAVGGIRATLADEREAVLVPPKTPEKLADALGRVIVDGAFRRGLIRQGREWARHQLERPSLAQQILQLIE